jgi:hypothetical protein
VARHLAHEAARFVRISIGVTNAALVGIFSDGQHLPALAKRRGEEAAFAKRVLDLRAQYPGRPGLQERFNEAGLPGL